jgi:glycosyltransferase involved in cell wall biosynthesis
MTRPWSCSSGGWLGSKRPDRFLDVAERVARSDADAVFLVAGGADPAELTELRGRVRQADVRFFGWVGDVGALHAAADLVVLTSDNEGCRCH